jgi:hypothetical protein
LGAYTPKINSLFIAAKAVLNISSFGYRGASKCYLMYLHLKPVLASHSGYASIIYTYFHCKEINALLVENK